MRREVWSTTFLANSIAQPVAIELATRPFQGHVQSVFKRACNVVSPQQKIITIALPEVGNGPFSILIEGPADLFTQLAPGQHVRGNQHHLRIGPWQIELTRSIIWDPQLPLGSGPLEVSPTVAKILIPYSHWPINGPDSLAASTATIARAAAQRLGEAIQAGTGLAEAASQLAGLGPGLTPAGDDYLVGVMAALWLAGKAPLVQEIARVAVPRTTLLSGAFLKAAAQGHFAAGWQLLAGALLQGNGPATAEACQKLCSWGATSGRDALAGFAKTLVRV